MAQSDLNSASSNTELVSVVDRNLRGRCTRKILAGAGTGDREQLFLQGLKESIALAGTAPFHYARLKDLPEPWRFRVFHGDSLVRVNGQLSDADLLYGRLTKIFHHVGAVILATWLPETDSERLSRNWEHSVATGAAVQNLLLASEARGIGSYWCSAPNLGVSEAMKIWGAKEGEELIGVLFMGWPLSPEEEAEFGWSGKMRERRTSPDAGWGICAEE